jgi:hypothetical protein
MFLRSSVVKKGGKTYRYWKLVENVRTETGPRQRVVAHLGDLSNFTAGDWQDLAGRMGEPEMAAALQRRVRQSGRSGRPPKWTLADRAGSASDASDVVSIRLSATSWREPVAFGDVYTALVLWKRLGLGELLGERMNGSAAKVPWPTVAALIAVNRLVEPMPEWPMVRWWQRTALPQLLGIPLAAINDDRLYRCLDLVLPHKQAIEERIAGVGQSFFGQSYRYLLYDLTSTYFEGQMESNPKARRGYSRDHRPDCQQVTIGAVVDRRVQSRTHRPVGERPTEAKRLRPRSWGGVVARKQDGGALRQHARKGVCATHQVATCSERRRSLVTRISGG